MTDTASVGARYRRLMWASLALLAAGCVAGIVVPAGLGWDFANFYDAGRRVAAGQIADLYNPDSLIGGQPPQGTTGFFGTPISAVLYVPLARFGAETALVLFKIQNVLVFGVTFVLVLSFYRRFAAIDRLAQQRFAALFALAFLIYQPFWTIFRVGGQTTPTVLMLWALGLVLHTNGRAWGSITCVVLATLLKPALAPAVLFLALASGPAFLWRLAAAGAGGALASILLMGWPVHAAFIDLMTRTSQVTYAWYFNSSLYVVIDNLRLYAGPDAAAGVQATLSGLTMAVRIAVALGVLWLAWQSRRQRIPPAAQRHFDFLLATVFFLLSSPTIWEHYLSLLFLPLIYVVAAERQFSRGALGIVALAFVVSIGQNLIIVNWLRYGFTFDTLPDLVGIALFKSAPLLLTVLLMWRHRREWLAAHASPEWER